MAIILPLLLTLLLLHVQTLTIKVQSPLFTFRRDLRLDELLQNTYDQVSFQNQQQILDLIQIAIKSEDLNSMRNIRLYIEGEFSTNTVKVSHALTIQYEKIVQCWYKYKGKHKMRLQMWLRGDHSDRWLNYSREKMDFDEIQIIAVYDQKCEILGGVKFNISNCNISEVIYQTRQIDNSTHTLYYFKNSSTYKYSIYDINQALRIYLNHSSQKIIVLGKYYFQYGDIIQFNQTIPRIVFQRQGKVITVNSTILVSQYLRKNLAEVYNCVNRSIYYGGWKNGAYHGMGYEIAQRINYRYLGSYKNGNKQGRGLMIICNQTIEQTCNQILETRNLHSQQDIYTGAIFIGQFQDNMRKYGIHRKSHQLELGRYSYYYNTTNSDRLYLAMKLTGFSMKYAIANTGQYFQRRYFGLLKNGIIDKAIYQLFRVFQNKNGLIMQQNYTGKFDNRNQPLEGIYYDRKYNFYVIGDLKFGTEKISIISYLDQQNYTKEIYYGKINKFTQKEGKAISHAHNYSYFGEFHNDHFHGFGNLTMKSQNISYQGYFKQSKFTKGVLVNYIEDGEIVSEGYFINNKPASNSITYRTNSNMLIKGNNETFHMVSNDRKPFSKVISCPQTDQYVIVTEKQL